MTIFLLLLILIAVFLMLLKVYPIKIAFGISSYDLPDYNITFSWLNPFIKGRIQKFDDKNIITVYLFDKKIIQRPLNKSITNLKDKIGHLKRIKPEYIGVHASYGAEDPSITGMIYGAISAVSSYIDFDELHLEPDFLAESSFFNMKGIIKLNLLNVIMNY